MGKEKSTPRDHCLAKPHDAKQWPSGIFFYLHLTLMKGSYNLISIYTVCINNGFIQFECLKGVNVNIFLLFQVGQQSGPAWKVTRAHTKVPVKSLHQTAGFFPGNILHSIYITWKMLKWLLAWLLRILKDLNLNHLMIFHFTSAEKDVLMRGHKFCLLLVNRETDKVGIWGQPWKYVCLLFTDTEFSG